MTPTVATRYAFRNVEIDVWAGVFQPNKTTELLLDAVLAKDLSGRSALDLGCGSGVVGSVVRLLGKPASMSGSDISPQAIANSRHNAQQLGLDVEFREGSLFEPWAGRRFDVIIDDVAAVADPFARLSPWYPPEIVCDAGVDGTINTIRMLDRAGDHLAPGGVLFFPTVSLSNEVKILEAARSRFPKVECLSTKSWPFKEDFWQRIAGNETCRKLIDEGIVKVGQRGSRWLWDTSIYLATAAPEMGSGPHNVAVLGATGAVGIEILKVLERRKFPVGRLKALASERSAGRTVTFLGRPVTVEAVSAAAFEGVQLAIFSAGGGTSREWAPVATAAGCVVVDNSSAFRADPAVPLVVPPINADDLATHRGLIANPNCTTAIALMALAPLHRAFGCRRVFASSYQAVSGTGARAIEELRRQVGEIAAGTPVTREVYPHQIAFNVLPHVDKFLPTGYTTEEMKMENEGRKILHHPSFRASMTCVRVPVYRAHSVAVSAEFEKPVTVEAARAVLARAPGLKVTDDPAANGYPMPLFAEGKDDCEVGRLRQDCAFDNGLCFWVSGDQLLRGAAWNAVEIAEVLLEKNLLRVPRG